MTSATGGFLYEHLAGELGEAISRGALRPGDRLPSVRRLAEEREVSVSTVLEAYLQLENAGLVTVKPKSGYFVRRRPGLTPEPRPPRACQTPSRISVGDAYMDILEAMRDPSLLPLGMATLDPSYLPSAQLNRIVAQLSRESSTAGARYEAPPGAMTLRRQVARRAVESGMLVAADELCTCIGATEGISLALQAVAGPREVVAVESPAYFGVLQAIERLNLRALEVPAHPRDGLDVSAFESAVRSQPVRALVCTPTVSNPLGAVMPEFERQRLVRVAARAGVAIVEDDVYGELAFDGARPRPLRAFAGRSSESHVILVSSVSKTLAPGYRVGWIAGGRWHDQVLRMKRSQSLACPALLGMAVAEFLDSGGYDRHLRRLRAALAGNVERYRDEIALAFPEGTRVSAPRGGYVLWVELPPRVDALALHRQARARGIVIVPGQLFSARQRFANFIRISAGTPWSERVRAGIHTVGRLAAA